MWNILQNIQCKKGSKWKCQQVNNKGLWKCSTKALGGYLPKPTNENKQVTIPLKDFQFIPKTVNEFSKTLLRYEPLNSEIQSIKKTLGDTGMGYKKLSIIL